MSSLRPFGVVSLLLLSCGSDPAPIAQLSLAESYDVVGVARLFPDGLTFARPRSFAFSLEGVRSSGGRALAEGNARGAARRAIGFPGGVSGQRALARAGCLIDISGRARVPHARARPRRVR